MRPTTFEPVSVSEWNPSDRMLIAPLTYPNVILAIATPRFRNRTRMRTRATSAYLEDGTSGLGARGSGARLVRLTEVVDSEYGALTGVVRLPIPSLGSRVPKPGA